MLNAVLFGQMKNAGQQLSDTLLVKKLKFRVFAAWLSKHRSGNKIRRKALARLN